MEYPDFRTAPLTPRRLPPLAGLYLKAAEVYAEEPVEPTAPVTDVYQDGEGRLVTSFSEVARPLPPVHVLSKLFRIDRYTAGRVEITRANIVTASQLCASSILRIHDILERPETMRPPSPLFMHETRLRVLRVQNRLETTLEKLSPPNDRDQRVMDLLRHTKAIVLGG